MTYTPTKWNTAQDKERFVTKFKNFVTQGFARTLFTHAFYQHMSLMRGHIAHYNQDGFYETHFSTPVRRACFLARWTRAEIYGDPAYTFSDVETVLADWLRANPQYEDNQRRLADHELETAERAELARLQTKYRDRPASTITGQLTMQEI